MKGLFGFGKKKCEACSKVISGNDVHTCDECGRTWCPECTKQIGTGKGYCKECEQDMEQEDVEESEMTTYIYCNGGENQEVEGRHASTIQKAIEAGTKVLEFDGYYFVVDKITYFFEEES